jgi:hypothetical protein
MRVPRSTRGAFRRRSEGADRGRWSRQGATRTPASRQPKLHGPGPPAADHGALGGCARRRYPSPARSQGPLAVDRLQPAHSGRGLKGQSTGGRAEQASNIARGTLENERTCGRSNCRCLDVARYRGPWVREGPGVPRHPRSFGRRTCANLGRQTRRENANGCHFPSPACGRGWRAKRAGRGSVGSKRPLPARLALLRRATLSRKRERGKEALAKEKARRNGRA